MRPVLQFQPQIEALCQPLVQALRAMLAAIQAGWNAQHNGDGGHTAVTAESASVTGLTTLGKVRLTSVIYSHDASPSVNDLTTDGLTNVSWLRIFPAGNFDLTGIDATGREVGDRLLITNCSTGGLDDITLVTASGFSLSANRFANGTNCVVIGGRGVELIYDYDVTGFFGPRLPCWRIIDQA